MAAKKKTAAKTKKGKPEKGDRYPRQNRGRFAAGNPGKPPGATNWANRKIAIIAREYLDAHADGAIAWLIKQRKNPAVLLATIEFLTERADGKAPQVVKHGLDPDSPEGLLLSMSGQPLPGQRSGGEGTGSGS